MDCTKRGLKPLLGGAAEGFVSDLQAWASVGCVEDHVYLKPDCGRVQEFQGGYILAGFWETKDSVTPRAFVLVRGKPWQKEKLPWDLNIPMVSHPDSEDATGAISKSASSPIAHSGEAGEVSPVNPAFSSMAKTARDLAPQIRAFLLGRIGPPDPPPGPTPPDYQQKYEEYNRETHNLFVKNFGQQIATLVQELRSHGMADFRLDLDLKVLRSNVVPGDIPERLEFVVDHLASNEGGEVLNLPYHRHLTKTEAILLKAELKRIPSGKVGIVYQDSDLESEKFAGELGSIISAIKGWKVQGISAKDISNCDGSMDASGLGLLGSGGNSRILSLYSSFAAVRIHPMALATAPIDQSSDATIAVCRIPRWN